MNIIEAQYSINTPMFLGSVDRTSPELRPTSFKGMLRFWFRALALAEFNGNMKEVERMEGIIFGSAGEKESQKALFSLKILRSNLSGKKIQIRKEQLGIKYLGFQTINKRKCFEYGKSINIVLIENKGIRNKVSAEDYEICKNLLINTLKIIGIFGGLGSRVRRGFGSLTLLDLKLIDKSNNESKNYTPNCGDVESLKKEINDLLKKAKTFGESEDDIKYTAFSKFTKVVITKEFNNPMKLLDEIGKEMIRYRSCKKNKKVAIGEKDNRVFIEDCILIYKYSNTGKICEHPRRVVFGLPHNYRLSNKKTVNINSISNINSPNKKAIIGRRASPLFIHVHKLASGRYIGILILIPCKFLKNGDEIIVNLDKESRDLYKVLNGKDLEPEYLPVNISYKVIEDYLDRVVNKLSGCKVI